ncbi:MAG: asparagine synthase (glutamine-hydrolyzing) [Burkholderiales bacterium]|nr:asparagine synthase (glutamine-hydrolyzing) [Burkholderiales bacterium]
MCGLSALFAAHPVPLGSLVRAMTGAVAHRGPDDEGYLVLTGAGGVVAAGGAGTPEACYGHAAPYAPRRDAERRFGAPARAALGHRRLSIIDVSAAGHQPMCSADAQAWIAYNGEIYNYLELREELAAHGAVFHTRTDTEVILAAWARWGGECLSRLNGMFSFVLVDRARGRVLAARDRFGVKPLYYWVAPGGLVAFASEVKQFAVLPGWCARLNGQRAYDFLNWALLDHTGETLFEGVHQLRGGEALEFDLVSGPAGARPGGPLAPRRWYTVAAAPFAGSFPEAAAGYGRLLADSVRLRLRADVPVGSCLSGGLDSSSIVCVMNDLLRERDARALQKTFSACSSVARFDERRYIDEVVRARAVEPHYVYPGVDGLFPALERITWHQDEPFGSTSIYAQWCVFGLAAENRVKVMLDGQGADEQLAGYHNYFAPRFGRFLRRLRLAALAREAGAVRRLHGYSPAWGLMQAMNNVMPEWLRQPLRRLAGKPGTATAWFDLERLRAAPRDPFLAAGGARARSVREMSIAQLTATSLPMLLHWEDRDSMAHSIEARVPFLDYRLVEFALGLPETCKIAAGETKRVLREAMRGTLPEAVRARVDKMGFVTAEEVWLREEAPRRFRAALAEAIEVCGGALRPDLLGLVDRMAAGGEPFSFLPWRAISFGAWMKVFGVRV